MFVATGAYDIFSRIQEHTDSAVRIFNPYELSPLTLEEVTDAINILSKKQKIEFEPVVLKKSYEVSEGNPYYIQVIAYNCFEEAQNNKITLSEFEKSFSTSLAFLSQREFRGMYENAANEERKILDIFLNSKSDILSFKEINENESIRSVPSKFLKTMTEKNLLIRKSRGKYKLRDKMFKEYLKNIHNNGT